MANKFLYVFTYKSNIYRYCSGNKDIIHAGNTYKGFYGSHSRLTASIDEQLCKASIYSNIENELVQMYMEFIPSSPVTISIHKMRPNGTLSPRYWGRVDAVLITNNYDAEIKIVPPISTEKTANRFTYQSTCNHILFDPNCGLDINDFSFVTTVSNVTEDRIEITVNDIFKTGVTDPEWLVGGRMIIEQTGAACKIDAVDYAAKTITLLSYFNVNIGDQVRLAAGCNKSRDHCLNKFNNLSRQSAKKYVPGRDPTKGL